ncbi:MAG: hypothetical protein D6806_12430, partial [Deltaproteobacteria bacterium]
MHRFVCKAAFVFLFSYLWLVPPVPWVSAGGASAAENKPAGRVKKRPGLRYEQFRRKREIDVRMEQKRKAIRAQ